MSEVSYRATFTDATRPEPGADRIGNLLHRQEVALPEGVRASFEVANPFMRVFALGLDLCIIGGVSYVLVLLFAMVIFPLLFASPFAAMLLVAVMLVVLTAINLGYFIFFEGYCSGRTLGKTVFGLRVINYDGTEIGPREGVARAFLRMGIVGPMPAFIALGLMETEYLLMVAPLLLLGFVMFIDKKSRGIPDMVAGTLVVQMKVPMEMASRPYVPPYFMLPQHMFPLSHAELSRLTPEDYARLEEFGTRLSTIRSNARQQAATAAAAALARRMKYSQPIPPNYAEQFLFEMHAAIKQQLQQLYPDLYA